MIIGGASKPMNKSWDGVRPTNQYQTLGSDTVHL